MFSKIALVQLFLLFAYINCIEEDLSNEERDSFDSQLLGAENLFAGNRTNGDRKEHFEFVLLKPFFFQSASRVVTYNGTKTVTRVEAKSYSFSGKATLTAGGPGTTSATVTFSSGPFFPVVFGLYIYAI